MWLLTPPKIVPIPMSLEDSRVDLCVLIKIWRRTRASSRNVGKISFLPSEILKKEKPFIVSLQKFGVRSLLSVESRHLLIPRQFFLTLWCQTDSCGNESYASRAGTQWEDFSLALRLVCGGEQRKAQLSLVCRRTWALVTLFLHSSCDSCPGLDSKNRT